VAGLPRWTHLALSVTDIDTMIDWYTTYTPLQLLVKREDAHGYGAWLGHPDAPDTPFILVFAQQVHEAAGVPAPTTPGDDLRVELVDESGQRQPGTVAIGFGQTDRQVLAHPLDRETEVELAPSHGARPVVHLPTLRSTLADHVHDLIDVEARLLGEVHGLRQTLHHAGDADLVHHLRQLARSRRSHQLARPGIGADHRTGGLEHRRVVAAAHHGELTVLGASLSSRHGCVDEPDADRCARCCHLAGHIGRGGGVVDQDGTRCHPGQHPVRPECHLAHVVVVAHAHHHERGVLRRLARRRFARPPLSTTQARAFTAVRL
jgi:catechol 2,3-dioxygenase-like lactoylglutathione lyase family enzyme